MLLRNDHRQCLYPADGQGWRPQVPVIIKVPMARFQGVAYNWIKATGTLRLDPDSLLNANTFRTYAPLNNKVMELRKVAFPHHIDRRMFCPLHRASTQQCK